MFDDLRGELADIKRRLDIIQAMVLLILDKSDALARWFLSNEDIPPFNSSLDILVGRGSNVEPKTSLDRLALLIHEAVLHHG